MYHVPDISKLQTLYNASSNDRISHALFPCAIPLQVDGLPHTSTHDRASLSPDIFISSQDLSTR